MPLTEGIGLVAEVISNPYIQQRFLQMKMAMERGTSLTVSATSSEIFTPLIIQMMAVGEETGELENMLEKVGELYQDEVATAIVLLSERLNVIVLLAVAGMVLVLALGVFLPMWNMTQFAAGR